LGYTQGTYTLTITDPKTKKPVTDKGKYVTAYKKQADGTWKAVADMVSSDIPLPAPGKK
jgi:ketosteroid isomerase-like protein